MRIFIIKIFNIIIDLIFPPNKEELEIREISPQSFISKVKRAKKPEFYFINSIIAYKDPLVKELIWQIKYKKNKYAIKIAGFILYNWLYENIDKECIIIPIPVSKKRRRERGYNQCELIIEEIMRLYREKLDIENKDTGDKNKLYNNYKIEKNYNILIREKNLSRQTLKNKKERLEANNIFKAIVDNSLLDKRIIIIDDVTTTGNTLKEAYSAMKEAQYKDISVVALAH